MPCVPNVDCTCAHTFAILGHLAHHICVHTCERNHKCPFAGCETHCSCQDSLASNSKSCTQSCYTLN
ncbi:hypothetical protein K439DRAFT_1375998 [Ramaria rubella]|nr:hypothetical protein K439DRAFT_1375998 [Ramaria rubella]